MDWEERARRLVGVRFRAQGRDPETGLDCVGLALAAYGLPPSLVRADYRLRGNHLRELQAEIGEHFRSIATSRTKPGDLLLFKVSDDQFHLGTVSERGVIHADAGSRKVVERPGVAPWPIIAAFRRRKRQKKAH